jgi:glycosyltransferase involved in cell wall biosynthesis
MRPGILLVSPWLYDGGTERVLELKAQWLVQRGYRVHVLVWDMWRHVSGRANPVLGTLARAGVPVSRARPIGSRWHIAQRALRIAALALRGRYGVIVGHEIMANLGVLEAKRILGERVRIVTEFHTSLKFPDTGIDEVTRARASRLLAHADGIVAVSNDQAREVASYYGVTESRVQTFYNFFDLETIASQSLESAPDIPPEPFILGCGRLVAMKGFPDLIRAFAEVRRRHRLRLVILGEGPDRAELVRCAAEAGVADDVLLPGFMPNPFPWFARAAAFCLSSRYGEAFGRVLVEAMALGTPVVATRCHWGPEEVLGGGKYGLLCEPGDAFGLAQQIARLMDDGSLRQELTEAGRSRAADFDQRLILPALERYYVGERAAAAA